MHISVTKNIPEFSSSVATERSLKTSISSKHDVYFKSFATECCRYKGSSNEKGRISHSSYPFLPPKSKSRSPGILSYHYSISPITWFNINTRYDVQYSLRKFDDLMLCRSYFKQS